MRSLWSNPLSIFAALCVLAAGVARADSFDAANQLYEAGKYDQARQAYQKMVESGPLSANLFYNLGNADWKLGDSGKAIVDYERALALQPSHPQARANLDFAREQTGAKIPAEQWWERALAIFDTTSASILLAVSAWVALFCVAVIVLRREGRTGPVVTLAIAVLVAAYAGGTLWEASAQSTRAVVISKFVRARVAPADVAPLADMLPAGSEVLDPKVLDPKDPHSWTYCTLPDGSRAWLRADSIERVIPGTNETADQGNS